MASLAQHKADCLKYLGSDYEDVHRWLDECFRELGPQHRRVRHHKEGITEAGEIFGRDAQTAAALHILRDCRHIPSRDDYRIGLVDALGLKTSWSTAAYIRYSDTEFEDLVREHLRPTALAMWAFMPWEDVFLFLTTQTLISVSEAEALKPQWETAREKLRLDVAASSLPLEAFIPLESFAAADDKVREHAAKIFNIAVPESSQSESLVGYIAINALTNPFVYLDYDLLEQIKPELSGSSPLELIRFALPDQTQASITIVGEPDQRRIMVLSDSKTMTVSKARLQQTPSGTEVSYVISSNAAGIVVAEAGGRFFLRNGVHRAFLLAQLGIDRVPCILTREKQPIPYYTSPYPMFMPSILLQPRQPLLADFLKPEFCIQLPVRRTKRLISISAEESSIPID